MEGEGIQGLFDSLRHNWEQEMMEEALSEVEVVGPTAV